MSVKVEKCANCKRPYESHVMPTTQCEEGSTAKWFPQSIADGLKRQRARILKAQHDLGKRGKA